MQAIITAPGDPSVGIQSTVIVIEHLPDVDDKDDLNFFVDQLTQCFSAILDDKVSVDLTAEQHAKKVEAEG